MASTTPHPTAFQLLWKIIKLLARLFVICVFVVLAVTLITPKIISSQKFHQMVEHKLSETLSRPVSIEKIVWNFNYGFIVKNINIEDDPQFSENSLIKLKSAQLDIQYAELLKRKLSFMLYVDKPEINIIRNEAEKINLNSVFDSDDNKEPQDKGTAKPVKKRKRKKLHIPLNIATTVLISDISMTYDDRKQNQKFTIHNGGISLNVPSLLTDPIDFTISADTIVNGHEIPRSVFNLNLSQLFNDKNSLSSENISVDMDALLPGIWVTVNGNMLTTGIHANIRINLEKLSNAFGPVIPRYPIDSNINGEILFSAYVNGIPEEPIAFDAKMDAYELSISGDVLKGKRIGPGSLVLNTNGTFDQVECDLTLDHMDLRILENTDMAMSGHFGNLKDASKKIDVTIAPLNIDLTEILDFANEFIPENIRIENQADAAKLSIDRLHVSGTAPEGTAMVSVSGLNLLLPDFQYTKDENQSDLLQLSDGTILIHELETQITDLFPASASLSASLDINALKHQNSKNEISTAGVKLDSLNLKVKKIKKTPASLFGIACELTVDNALSIHHFIIPDLVNIHSFEESLSATATIDSYGAISGNLKSFNLNAPELKIENSKLGPISTGCKINLNMAEINIDTLKPLDIDIKDSMTHIDIQDAIAISFSTNISDTGNSKIVTFGKAEIDIDSLLCIIPDKLLPEITAGGQGNLAFSFDGRIPEKHELEKLKSMALEGNLGFLENFDIVLKLKNGRLNLTNNETKKLIIKSLTGNPFISYKINGNTGSGVLNSNIMIKDITDIPSAHLASPISSNFKLSVEHDLLSSVDIYQTLSSKTLGIQENIQISLAGIDQSGESLSNLQFPAVLSDFGGKARAVITIKDCKTLEKFELSALRDIALNGSVSLQADIDLLPEKALNGNLGIAISKLDVSKKNTVSLENMNTNILLSKSYGLETTDSVELLDRNNVPHLSQSIINPLIKGPSFGETKNTNAHRHLQKINERHHPAPEIAVHSINLLSTPFPINIDQSRLTLDLENGVPNIDYFQFNFLDGTINGSINILKDGTEYHLQKAINFSGINTAVIFPNLFSGIKASETEINGSLYALIPLTDRLKPLLEDMMITIEFTKIGSRALERLLYALDPYESNEAIMSQRRYLKTGSPKLIQLSIKNGFLSLKGKIEIKSVKINLPRIQRLNIAQIPGIEKFEKNIASISPVIKLLNYLSAKNLIINKQNNSFEFK